MSPQGHQSILAQINLQIRVVTSFSQVLCSVFFKGHSPGHLYNGIFSRWAGLFIFLASHLPTILTVTLLIYSRSYQMLDLLEMLKKLIQICKDMEWVLDSKNKMLMPS